MGSQSTKTIAVYHFCLYLICHSYIKWFIKYNNVFILVEGLSSNGTLHVCMALWLFFARVFDDRDFCSCLWSERERETDRERDRQTLQLIVFCLAIRSINRINTYYQKPFDNFVLQKEVKNEGCSRYSKTQRTEWPALDESFPNHSTFSKHSGWRQSDLNLN